MKKKTVHIINLGCARNQVDSENLLGEFSRAGYSLSRNSKTADVIVINTCGFIQAAKEESINEILAIADKKKLRQKLIVTGCLPQRYMKELKREMPEADYFFGVYTPGEVMQTLEGKGQRSECKGIGQRVLLDSIPHHAYVKVSEGCNRSCGFCAIPFIRGKQVSRDIADIVNEVQYLQSMGIMEVSLIAQDLTFYGREKRKNTTLELLLKELIRSTDISWFRLMYAYPACIEEGLLDLVASEKRICRYLDLPVQHSSTRMLKLMRRGYTGPQLKSMIAHIRNAVPDITLRTTILVGHPGETERDLMHLLDFMEEVRFERLGGFMYSEEEGTYACDDLKAEKVPEKVSLERLERVMDLQQRISLELNQNRVGGILKVLIDRTTDEYGEFTCIGRTEADAPEIDNEVFIKGKGAKPGTFREVKVENAWEFDLEGSLIPTTRSNL
jgi:ribosomal protein S12 methylthiotransferase